MNQNSLTTPASPRPMASPSAGHEQDRSALLRETIALTMSAAYGLQKLTENQISQLLGNLVRTKLLSADDSYRLRDQLLDASHYDQALNNRIYRAMQKSGIVSQTMLNDLRTRIEKAEIKGRA